MSSFEMPDTITCPNCGTLNSWNFRSCRNCGRFLPRPAFTPRPSSPPHEEKVRGGRRVASVRNFSLTTLLAVSLFMLLLGTILGYFLALSGA